MTLTQVFAKVLNMSLTASLVIVLVIAARFVLRKSPKVFSYALWAVVLFRLLCPASLPSPVSLLGLLDAPVAQTEGVTTTVEYIPYKVVEAAAENPQPEQLPQNTVTQAPTQSQQTKVEPQREPLSAAEIITYIWLAGIAVMVIVGVGSYLRFRKHLTGAMQVKDNIYLVDHIDSAFVAGLIRPRVYLPSDIPLNQMGYIIAHEKYHIRRLDHVTKHLSFAALCIHWFNPFVWVAFILSGKDLEMSCDEAVIKRLGEGIRADYSASLLSLATGRRIIAGTPLAFGEGDTKGRINNMAKWKQPKKWVSIVSFILCFTILTACAANPTQNFVTSKNDGVFEENIQQTAPNGGGTTLLKQNGTFSSLDGSVEYTWNLDESFEYSSMPVVEVIPQTLTGEMVQQIAEAIFPGNSFYELGKPSERQFSREELERKIALLSQYDTTEKVEALIGSVDDGINPERDLASMRSLLSTASSDNPRSPTDWTFKSGYYEDDPYVSELWATTNMNGLDYTIRGQIFEFEEYEGCIASQVEIVVNEGLDAYTSVRVVHQRLMTMTERPTQEQIEALYPKVQAYLDKMGMGSWVISYSTISCNPFGEAPSYEIVIRATPEFEGVPALQGQRNYDPLAEDTYSFVYDTPYANFYFTADGQFYGLWMGSFVEVTEVKNTNVPTLSMSELLEKAQTHLSLYDSECFGGAELWSINYYYGLSVDDLDCKVEITKAEYGLGRFLVPNSDQHYYYAPAIIFKGTVNYYDKTTGELMNTLNGGEELLTTLVTINAVDGSIG